MKENFFQIIFSTEFDLSYFSYIILSENEIDPIFVFFSYSEIIAPNEKPTDASQSEHPVSSSSTVDDLQSKESLQNSKTINNDDDTKLHVARYHKTETDWEELLAQVCSSPMKEKDKCSSFCLP